MSFFRYSARRRIFSDGPHQDRRSALLTLAGILWASPLTLCGLLLALPIMIGKGQLAVVHSPTPALLVSGKVADYLLDRHPFGAMCAMAIGHILIADLKSLTPQILTHELAHVRQAAVWGALFPFAYLAASLWAVLHGHDAYWNNAFEVAARRAERHS
ncbi:hypothetical protein [Lacisediminimonas profundi]|uniref:hypothetical protein n=1 Tax=Lacisediminimonas profundi TaxID=2603856 RepID=UPI00124AF239|nr:hypothetical protein [Lacisediminimonas profundi]